MKSTSQVVAVAFLFTLLSLLSCTKQGNPSTTSGTIDIPKPDVEQFPLVISWKTPPSEPILITDAPELFYKKMHPLDLNEVQMVIKISSETSQEHSSGGTFAITKKFLISGDSGTFSKDVSNWTLAVRLVLSFQGAFGRATIRVAFFKPIERKPAFFGADGTPLADDFESERPTSDQRSNWLELPSQVERE